MTKRIVILASNRVQALDVTGPASVFAAAATSSDIETFYKVEVVSPNGGVIDTVSGVELNSTSIDETKAGAIDTLLVAGHDRAGVERLIADDRAREWFTSSVHKSRRWGSVCSGSFVLAAWGLLEGRRATTHWSTVSRFRREFTNVRLDPDALYVIDDNIWTSAGVTSGIDMALAMVEDDGGADIAAMVAKRLVVYLRRPGHQSQFSDSLKAQCDAAAAYSQLIDWIKNNLAADLGVTTLAERAGQSARTFQRNFAKEIGSTPAAFVESLRLDRAKALIASNVPLQTVAAEIGYPNSSRLSIVFQRKFGVSPSIWKTMHTGNSQSN